MRESIKEVLIGRDGMTADEADEAIKLAKADFDDFLADGNIPAAEEVLSDHFGLEPDYLDEFL